MTAFRICLVMIWVVLTGYTILVIANHGLGLFDIFFRDMSPFGWAGQFDLDFLFMLILSSLWVAWRNEYSASGLGLGLVALFGGSLFLSTYLLVLTFSANGNMKEVLIGEKRAGA
jgi:hypothetical protein